VKIKKITKVPPEKVYAIETTTKTFIADGLAHHNCMRCNIHLSGNYVTYREKMVEKHGEEFVKNLEQRRHEITKDFDYETEIDKYKKKCQDLGITVH
jgi:hypothetical protein